jgi:hypothetical protein
LDYEGTRFGLETFAVQIYFEESTEFKAGVSGVISFAWGYLYWQIMIALILNSNVTAIRLMSVAGNTSIAALVWLSYVFSTPKRCKRIRWHIPVYRERMEII